MYACGFLAACAITKIDALQLAPVVVHQTVVYNLAFEIGCDTDANKIGALIKQGSGGSSVALANQNLIGLMAQEILLASGQTDTEIRHKRWSFTMTTNFGELEMIDLVANIDGTSVKIDGTIVKLTQPIPTVYEVKEHCARTGRRRGFFRLGRRSMVCVNHNVPRGLTAQEINEVNQSLLNKAGTLKIAA